MSKVKVLALKHLARFPSFLKLIQKCFCCIKVTRDGTQVAKHGLQWQSPAFVWLYTHHPHRPPAHKFHTECLTLFPGKKNPPNILLWAITFPSKHNGQNKLVVFKKNFEKIWLQFEDQAQSTHTLLPFSPTQGPASSPSFPSASD